MRQTLVHCLGVGMRALTLAFLCAAAAFAATLATGCATALSVNQGVLDYHRVQTLECVSVLPFENTTGEANAGVLVAQEVSSALLTSERFNVLAPAEAQQLLQLFDVPLMPRASTSIAKKYGEVLGVQAVLIGSVTEFGHEDLSLRTPLAESVVGFTARLVETSSGQVIWTASASDFDYPVGLAIPQARSIILRDVVADMVQTLVSARTNTLARRGLCAGAYASLEKGERPTIASMGELRALAAEASATPLERPKSSPVVLASLTTTPAPARVVPTPAPSPPPMTGSGTGTSPAMAPASPAAPALPATPSLGSQGGMALPDLPPLEGDSGGLTATGGAPLPALPPEASVPPEPTAIPVGPPPKSLLAKLKGPSKVLLTKLYRLKKPTALAADFPKGGQAAPTLTPRTKKSLADLVTVMRAAPDMRVRFDVHADFTGKDASDAAMKTVSQKQGKVLVDYMHGVGIAPDRVSFYAYGRSKLLKPKGAAANNRVELAVLQYPGGAEAVPALPPLPSVGSDSAIPALPDLPADNGAGPAPAPASLPALPPAPPMGSTSGDVAPAPKTAPPPQLMAKMGARPKALLTQFYKTNDAVLATDFPKQLAQKPALFPKSKQSLNELVALVRAATTMKMRLDVQVDASGPGMTDAVASERAATEARLITDYLVASKAPMDRISVKPAGRGKAGKGKGVANTKVEVKVVSYP